MYVIYDDLKVARLEPTPYGRPLNFVISMTFYFVSHVMPKHLLDDPCAMHPVISVDHQACDRQYRHAVHKSQVVHTTNRFPL